MAQQHSGAIRVSLACVQCRSRHLRCDAVTPICSRCVREGSECTYLKSRRGGRARAKRDSAATAPELPSTQNSASKAIPRTLPERESLPSLTPDHSGSSSTSASSLGADEYLGWFPESDSGPLTRAPLLELYYTYFHPAQPCALPLRFLRQKASEEPPGIRLLVNVLQFIGSLYAPKVKSGPLEDLVKASLEEPRLIPNGFEVQALVLYSIAVYWCDEIERARELLDEAIRKAIVLRMNFREFATEHSGGDAVLAESWRRTWWQLYSTDAHIASSNHVPHFGTSQRLVSCTVELPCEEDEYCSGAIPTPRTTDEYDNREFAEDDSDFSSFAYLIGLGRSLDHTIVGIPRVSEANVKLMCTNADSCISAWLSLLSKKKRRFFKEDGTLDELLFKANFLIQIYTVDIHRYLSTLAYSSIESISTCAPPPPPDRLGPIYSRDAHIHTAKILRAIERIADMLTLPIRLARHTPFNICMIATMTIAHLSACKYVFTGEQLKVARERIRVAMGALEVFAEIWPRAKKVVGEVKIVARTLLSLEPRPRQASIASPKPIESPLHLSVNPTSQSQSPQDRYSYSGAQSPQDLPADDLRSTIASQQYIDCSSLTGLDTSGYFDFPGIGFDMDMDAFASNDLCSDLSLKTGFPFGLDVPIPY